MDDSLPYKYKLTLAYDGTHYSGWQIQPNGTSIQELIQQKLGILMREPTHVTGAGRTDAGVHALGQTAHFSTNAPINLYRIRCGLNGLLPKDIRVNEIEEVSTSFHARYSATGKIYHYHLHLDAIESPFHRLYRWHILHKLDLNLLMQAAAYFVGTHDFTAFANESHRGSAAHDAVRTIERLDVVLQEGGARLEFAGNGFLYKMVRNIVGTLVEAGAGKRPPEEMAKLILSKDRKLAGKAAPAHGLFLVEVKY